VRVLCGPQVPLAQQWQLFSAQLTTALLDRFLLLHAAAVVLSRRDRGARESPVPRACLFVGSGGSGKTTLGLAAAQRGHTLMGDDLVALDWRSGRLYAMPFPLRPRPDVRRTLGASVARICRRPAVTDPARAPFLVRTVSLETNPTRRRSRPGSLAGLLDAVHVGEGGPTRALLKQLLHGVRHSDFLSVARLPPVGCSLRSQARLCESLFRGVPEPRPEGDSS